MRKLIVVALAVLLAPAGASAAKLETIDLPSRVVDESTANFNAGGALKATVMLPDGYDRRRTYPLLLLLHGAGDTYETWAKPGNGDIRETAAGLNAIVVMPDAATGFYTNWWRDGLRGDPAWETYFLDEVLPAIRHRYRIRAGRRWHAVAGLSMGGFGATFLGGRVPGYFGSVSSFSGFVDHQRPTVYGGGMQAVARVSYETIFGPPDAFYATGHNPARLIENLSSSRVYLASGDGTVDPAVGSSSPQAAGGGGAVELEIRQQNDSFVRAADAAGVDVEYAPHAGIHDWPYWRNDLRAAIARDLFAPVPARPARWTNTTVAQHGELFGVGYAFATPPDDLVHFARDGQGLTVTGPAARRHNHHARRLRAARDRCRSSSPSPPVAASASSSACVRAASGPVAACSCGSGPACPAPSCAVAAPAPGPMTPASRCCAPGSRGPERSACAPRIPTAARRRFAFRSAPAGNSRA